jgi:hypothetical protein
MYYIAVEVLHVKRKSDATEPAHIVVCGKQRPYLIESTTYLPDDMLHSPLPSVISVGPSRLKVANMGAARTNITENTRMHFDSSIARSSLYSPFL